MQFHLHSAALPADQAARLFLCTAAPADETAALLYGTLTESEPFAAARTPANGSFADTAVLKLDNTGHDTLAKAFRHATGWAQKQPVLAIDLSAFSAAELANALNVLTTARNAAIDDSGPRSFWWETRNGAVQISARTSASCGTFRRMLPCPWTRAPWSAWATLSETARSVWTPFSGPD